MSLHIEMDTREFNLRMVTVCTNHYQIPSEVTTRTLSSIVLHPMIT